MVWTFRWGSLVGLTLLLLGQGSVLGEQPGGKAEPKPPWQRLLQGEDAKKAEEFYRRIGQYIQEDKYQEALKLEKELLALRSRVQGEDHWQTLNAQYGVKGLERVAALPEESRREFATLAELRSRAGGLTAKGQYRDAQPILAQVLRINRKYLGDDHPHTASSLNNLALNLKTQSKYDEADPLYRQALALRRKLLSENHPDTATSLNNLALSLNNQGKHAEAEPLYRQAVAVYRKIQGDNDPDTATCLNNLAANLSGQRKFKEAEAFYREALTLRRKNLGENHVNVAHSLTNLAGNLEAQGKQAEAEPLYRQALALRRKNLGEDHPQTVTSFNKLAFNLDDQGKYDEAEPLFRQALALFRKHLGDNNPNTATSLTNLALNLNHQGKWDEAEPLFRQALNVRRKLLGENHLDTANSLEYLARNLNGQAKYDEAEKLFRQALILYRKLLGETHRDTANCLSALAGNQGGQGKYAEAEPMHRQALAVYRQLLGENHRDTAACLNNLALNLKGQGKYDEAEPLFRQALELRRKILGETHPHTADSLGGLATLLNAQGKYPQAEALDRQALALYRKVLGETHPRTADSLNNLAINQYAQGKYAEAEALYRQALVLRRKLLGETHPSVADSFNNLAANLNSQGKYAEAEALYRKALALTRQRLGENHPKTATSLNNLAYNLDDQGKYAEAESLYRQALVLRRKLLGENHPHVAQNLSNLAASLDEQAKYPEAEALYQQALALRRKLLGENHPDVADNLNNLAGNLNRQCKYAEAELLYRQALALYRQLLGENHPHITNSLSNLAANLSAQGKDDEAEKYLEQAADAYLRMRTASARAGLDRASHASAHSPLQRLAALKARQGKPDQAWQRLEQGLGRATWDELVLRQQRSVQEQAQFDQLEAKLLLVDQQISQTLSEVNPSPEQDQLRKDLLEQQRKLYTELDGLHRRLEGKYGIREGISFPLANIQRSLPRDTALLAWVDTGGIAKAKEPNGNHWAVLVRSKGTPLWVRLPGTGPENSWTEGDDQIPGKLKTALNGGTPLPASALADLTQKLTTQRFSPLRPYLAAKDDLPAIRQVVVLPSPWMDGVPVELLVEGITVSYAPSATLFAYLQEQKAPASAGVLALGDPLFAPLETKVLVSRGDPTWKPLPGTRGEVETLKLLCDASKRQVRVLTGSEASEQKLYDLARSRELGQFRYLHLATHGQMDPFLARQSAIILARDRLPDPLKPLEEGQHPFDGRLTAQEVLDQWKLDAELVTLSACQTGLGKHEGGEGYMGFAQAVLLSGSRSVCLSLWKVDDTATMLLMDRFYRNLLGQRDGLAKPMGKAEALAEAKHWLRTLPRKEVLDKAAGLLKGVVRDVGEDLPPLLPERPDEPKDKNEPPFAHPRYWAAFILIGDPK